MWKLEPINKFEESRIESLLDLTSNLESGILPGSLTPFAFFPDKIKKLLILSKAAHESIMSTKYPRDVVDTIVAFSLFCFQSEKLGRRKELCFTPGSLVSLVHPDLRVSDRVILNLKRDYDDVEIAFKIQCLINQDGGLVDKSKKIEMIGRTLSSNLSRFFFRGDFSVGRLKEIFKDVRMTKEGGVSISFTASSETTHMFDYQSITFNSITDTRLIIGVRDLVLFLIGFDPEASADLQSNSEEDEDFELDDVLKSLEKSDEPSAKTSEWSGKVVYSDDEY